MGGADKFSLGLDTAQTTEPEAAKTADFFDLSEYGFDSCFAQGIQYFADRAQQGQGSSSPGSSTLETKKGKAIGQSSRDLE